MVKGLHLGSLSLSPASQPQPLLTAIKLVGASAQQLWLARATEGGRGAQPSAAPTCPAPLLGSPGTHFIAFVGSSGEV